MLTMKGQHRSFRTVAAMAWLAFSGLSGRAQRGQESPAGGGDPLRTFLRNYLAVGTPNADRTVRYSAVFVDLSGEGKHEAIVYITGREWCGSGGCTMLILAHIGSSFRVVTKVTITRPPIRVLAGVSHGWRNLGVRIQGGGVEGGYEAELRFDGKTYPRNPSIPPARPSNGKDEGEIVVPADGTPVDPRLSWN